MANPSDHLLRTFGAVPVSSRVLDLGCGHGRHTDPLARLGFDVYACDNSPEAVGDARTLLENSIGGEEATKRVSVSQLDALGYPDDFFDWVVAYGSLSRLETRDDMLGVLEEAHRVIRPGGWIYIVAPALPDHAAESEDRGYAGDSGLEPSFTPRTLDELLREAGFVAAEPPSIAAEGDERKVRAIYRRMEADTPV